MRKKINQPEVLGELIAGVLIGVVMVQMNSPVMTLLRHQDDVDKVIQSSLEQTITWKEAIEQNLYQDPDSDTDYVPEFNFNHRKSEFLRLQSDCSGNFFIFKFRSTDLAVCCRARIKC